MRKTTYMLLGILTGALFTISPAGASVEHLITGQQIKNGTVQAVDLSPAINTTRRSDHRRIANLEKAVRDLGGKIPIVTNGKDGSNGTSGTSGKDGTTGVAGLPGTVGPKGDTGSPGANGPQGEPGVPGQNGKDAVQTVHSFGGELFNGFGSNGCNVEGPGGTVEIGQDHVVFGPFPDGNASASVYTGIYNGLKLKDISLAAFDAKYDQDPDAGGGAPYLRIFLDNDTHDVIYSPNSQGRTLHAGEWHHEVVTSGVLRFDDDSGDGTGPYGINGAAWNTVVGDEGDRVISGIYVSAGCSGAYSDGATAYLDNLELTVAGQHTVFDFGA